MPEQNNPKSNVSTWKQATLALLAALGFGIYLYDLYPDGQTEVFSQMAFRLAIVLTTVWLAFPQLEQFFRNFSTGILITVLLVAFVIARNPLILISIVVLCVILAILNYAIRVFNSN